VITVINKKYIHKKSGNEYRLLHITNQAATKDGWIEQAVYADSDSNIWSCCLHDFYEKFEEVE